MDDWSLIGFWMIGPISSSNNSSIMYDLKLLAGFLVLDGLTSTFQKKLFREHVTSKYNQMLHINLGSCIFSSFTLIAFGSLTLLLELETVSGPDQRVATDQRVERLEGALCPMFKAMP